MMTALPDPIGHPSGDRFRHHGQSQLRAEHDRDLGIVEPDLPGVDRQEAEKGAVAEIHDRPDAGRDKDRRCPEHLGEPLPEPAVRAVKVLVWRRGIDLGEQQHYEQRQHAERADQKIGQRKAAREIENEPADERPSGRADIVR